MKLIFIFLILSISTNITILSMDTQPQQEPTPSTCPQDDEDDIENQLSEKFEKQCSTSQKKQYNISPKQHLENVRLILREPAIFSIIYEFVFGETDFDQESMQSMIQAIQEIDDNEIIPIISLFFPQYSAPLVLASATEHDVVLTKYLCKIPYYKKQINSLVPLRGHTILHEIAIQDLFDDNVREILKTLIHYGADVFAKSTVEKQIPIELTLNKEIKKTLERAMLHHPCKYIPFKCKQLQLNIKQQATDLRQYILEHPNISLVTIMIIIAGVSITLTILFIEKAVEPSAGTDEKIVAIGFATAIVGVCIVAIKSLVKKLKF